MKQWFVKPCSPARRVYGRDESRPYAKIMSPPFWIPPGSAGGGKNGSPAGEGPLAGESQKCGLTLRVASRKMKPVATSTYGALRQG